MTQTLDSCTGACIPLKRLFIAYRSYVMLVLCFMVFEIFLLIWVSTINSFFFVIMALLITSITFFFYFRDFYEKGEV